MNWNVDSHALTGRLIETSGSFTSSLLLKSPFSRDVFNFLVDIVTMIVDSLSELDLSA